MTQSTNKPIRQTRNKVLRAFLQDWLDWVDRGAPDWGPYSCGSGLCSQANMEVRDVLKESLMGDFGTSTYPFCTWEEYNTMNATHTQHLCPARLAWVRAKLGVK